MSAPEVHNVPLGAIRLGYSPRREWLDDKHVRALLEVIDQLPPIIVHEGSRTVIDGIHRLEAHRRASRTTIQVIFFSGDDMEALALAIRANVGHGKPLTLSEREAAAATLLGRCPERSNRWIARVCGLSHSTVGAVRKAVAAQGPATRIGQDGRRRAVSPVARLGNRGEGEQVLDLNTPCANTSPTCTGEAASDSHEAASTTTEGDPAGPPRNDHGGSEKPSMPRDEFLDRPREVTEWFERTHVSESDIASVLGGAPVGQPSEVIEECHRRARLWNELAEGLGRWTDQDRRLVPAPRAE